MRLVNGDSLDELPKLAENSIDAVVTDPPYGLAFMGKHWDYAIPGVDTWKRVFHVMKPGAHLLAFGGTRTYHRMVVAIEDAGFEIRDQIQWIYGSGFPKSLNIGNGWGTALKPANEPIVLARKPLSEKTVKANVAKWGTGGINIEQSRIEGGERLHLDATAKITPSLFGKMGGSKAIGITTQGRFPANVLFDEVAAKMLDGQSGVSKSAVRNGGAGGSGIYKGGFGDGAVGGFTDSGGASRFFFKAKSDHAMALECANANDVKKNSNPLEKLADFALRHAATQTTDLKTEELLALVGCIGSCKNSTQILSLANHVANQASIDTTETITSLWKLYGYALLAIGENTKPESLASGSDPEQVTRFLYCAKASKRERNAGLYSYERIDITTGQCKDVNTVAAQLLQRVISESTAKWLTAECGLRITVSFPKECKSIIETKIRQTIELKTLNSLIALLTKEYILDVCSNEALGLSLAESADSLRVFLLTITKGEMELARGAANAALKTLQSISESDVKPYVNSHATVKPITLMEYLCRLITPPGGIILDPFMGSGTTGCAAKNLGFDFIGIEREKEYFEIAKRRVGE